MKKSIVLFAAAAVLSAGLIAYVWTFAAGQIGQAALTEETVAGDRAAADGLTVSFSVKSGDELAWTSSFDYGENKSETVFRRERTEEEADTQTYEEVRFNGWSAAPYVTELNYRPLEGLQDQEIQDCYEKIQQRVMETGQKETGKIRLKDYLDYYPVSFQFQLGTSLSSSDILLNDLKVYDRNGLLEGGISGYDRDLELYMAFNSLFRIPVIDNEYQEYKVSAVESYDAAKALGYETEVVRPLGEGEDYYQFDPMIVMQEENIKDGKTWVHPDLAGKSQAGDADDSGAAKLASEYHLKNRMLFVVNNRTAKGDTVDVSQIEGGYGVYELPFELSAGASLSRGPKSAVFSNPKPVPEDMKMVYPLDETAEYAELSLSDDHRYLAVFSVKNGFWYVELIDADTWTSPGPFRLFAESENLSCAWGEDGSLAVTNHDDCLAVLARTEDEKKPYEVIYSGKADDGLDEALFDSEMTVKEHAAASHQFGVDKGLTVAVMDGKAALVQNLRTGDSAAAFRNAGLVCVVLDQSGVLYRGRLTSKIADLPKDMSEEDIRAVEAFLGGSEELKTVMSAAPAAESETDAGEKTETGVGRHYKGLRVFKQMFDEDARLAEFLIKPVREQNEARWAR